MSKNNVSFDWLRFSFLCEDWGILKGMGIDALACDWIEKDRLNKRFFCMPFEGVMVLTDTMPDRLGLPNGRFMVDFSGNGIGNYFQQSELSLIEFCELCLMRVGVKCNRLDLAFDDYMSYLDIERMDKMIDKRDCVDTLWRTHDMIKSKKSNSDNVGKTLYIGNRKSHSFARVYDKRAKSIREGVPIESLPESWIRFELELKGNMSDAVIRDLVATKLDSATAYGFLRSRINFRVKGKGAKARRNLCKWWERFTMRNDTREIKPAKPHATIEAKRSWVEDSVFKTLAMITMADGGDDFIRDGIEDARRKITQKDLNIINAYWERLQKTMEHGT